jgi:alpha-amylase/alpha-mannosidase (GH57 family)
MATGKRFVCIHGHFYQPPRENPWLEAVEIQDSAAPFHDWNERICAESYAPNGAARMLNEKKQIMRIVNNYARISFDFGPTLLSWLKENAQRTYRMVQAGERRSRRSFAGHSSAMAQVYNHMIMPLANRRDRTTQIRWGIADYEKHFGIEPEGMWLAETAADSETLELLAAHGIKFTVLAPHQCKRIRSLATPDGPWTDTAGATVDTTRPYLLRFESGVSMAVFFYNGPNSRAIAFEGLLNSGENFAARVKTGLKDSSEPQLASVATDGESYGHHHRHGEMALAYGLYLLEHDKSLKLTNYGAYLESFPPEYECEIVENTSWSCSHGVDRWRLDCGCNGGRVGCNQAWRAPLRQALDELRNALIPLTEEEGRKLFRDVWEARDGYIQVILDRSPESVDLFFAAHQHHALSERERIRALELMEMQRHAQLMYTSCGWFFDDIGGIETVQIIAYAARVLQLARELFGARVKELEPAFLARLATAKSADEAAGDGARIYRRCVENKELGLEQVAAHYAISSVFTSFSDETDLYCFRVQRISYDIFTSGRGRLALGRARIESSITGHSGSFSFAVLHFGDQNITAAVKSYADTDAEKFARFVQEAAARVQSADFPEVIRLLDREYGVAHYSLTSLFTDEQRRIVRLILNSTLWDIENSLTTIYQDHASLLHYLSQAGLPKPPALTLAAGFAINAGLRRAIEADPVDPAQMRSHLNLAKSDQVPLDTPTLSYIADQRMKRALVELQLSAGSLEVLERALVLARTLNELPFETNLWQAQNLWQEILRTPMNELTALAPENYPQWDASFNELGQLLSIDYVAMRAQETARLAALSGVASA